MDAVSGFDVDSRDLNSGTHTLSHLSSSRLLSPSISVCVCTHDICVWTGMPEHMQTSEDIFVELVLSFHL